jgi:cytoskeletal protein CcmA (bactofilin family)
MSFFSGGRREKPLTEVNPNPSPSLEAPKPAAKRQGNFETVIGRNATLSGELRCQTDILIDGTFEGILEIEGSIIVGETGIVRANIHARSVVVSGSVWGNISGKKVELYRRARVWGNISATSITTADGAFIDGRLIMMHEAAPDRLEAGAAPDPKFLEDELEA